MWCNLIINKLKKKDIYIYIYIYNWGEFYHPHLAHIIIVILGLLCFSFLGEKKGWGVWIFGLVWLLICTFASLCAFAWLYSSSWIVATLSGRRWSNLKY